jgi:hypothetical protein
LLERESGPFMLDRQPTGVDPPGIAVERQRIAFN